MTDEVYLSPVPVRVKKSGSALSLVNLLISAESTQGCNGKYEGGSGGGGNCGVTLSSSAGSIYSLRSFLKPDNSSDNDYTSDGEGSSAKSTVPQPIASWALTLKSLLDDPNGVSIFQDYCTKLLCEENLLFWQAVENFKTVSIDEEVQDTAKAIFANFIKSTGSHQVNLNSKTRKAVIEAIKGHVTNTLYDKCQFEIFELMRTDSYRKFLQSAMYQELLCLELDGKRLPWEPEKPRKKGLFNFLRKRAPTLNRPDDDGTGNLDVANTARYRSFPNSSRSVNPHPVGKV